MDKDSGKSRQVVGKEEHRGRRVKESIRFTVLRTAKASDLSHRAVRDDPQMADKA